MVNNQTGSLSITSSMTGNFIRLLTGLTLIFGLATQAFANLTTAVDRRQVTDADIITLQVRLENSTSSATPNFSILEKDFDVIGISGPNRSFRTSIVNGNTTSESFTEWQLSLRAKRLGNLTIPAFTLGGDRSSPIAIEVIRQTAAGQRRMSQFVFFETDTDTKETYVQGQVIYTIKLYYVDSVAGEFPPVPNIPDAVIETVESEKRYDAIINNRRFYVLEKRYAIFPQRSGTLEIPRETFAGTRGRGGLFSSGERVTAVSDAISVNVKPKPSAFSGDYWIPATSLTLKDNWDEQRPALTVGEPGNRTITLTVDGVAASLLPDIKMGSLTNAKVYEDPASVNESYSVAGVQTVKTLTIGIVPTQAGRITLPEIKIPWWNTQTDKLEVAVIPTRELNVAPAAEPLTRAPDVNQNQTLPGNVEQPTMAESTEIWRYTTILFALLWITTLGFWWQSRHRSIATAPARQTLNDANGAGIDANRAFDNFAAAAKSNNPILTQNRLFLWVKAKYPQLNANHELARVKGDQRLKTLISELEAAAYGPQSASSWQGAELLSLISDLHREKVAKAGDAALAGALNPLS